MKTAVIINRHRNYILKMTELSIGDIPVSTGNTVLFESIYQKYTFIPVLI